MSDRERLQEVIEMLTPAQVRALLALLAPAGSLAERLAKLPEVAVSPEESALLREALEAAERQPGKSLDEFERELTV
jgi:hypothetical protein